MAALIHDAATREPRPRLSRRLSDTFREWPEKRRGVVAAVGVFVVSRLVTVVVAYGVALVTGPRSLVDVLSGWDGAFYVQIAETGYTSGAAGGITNAMAFLPAYPLAMRVLSTVFGTSPALAGVMLSTAAGAGAMAVIWLLVRRLTDAVTAIRTVVLVSFFPSAYVLSMVYPDALFLLVASATLLALLSRRWALAGSLAAIATAVRPNGVVLVLCCLWAAVAEVRRSGSSGAFIAPILAPLGGLAYAVYLWAVTGSPSAYLQVQDQTWGMRFDFGASNARMLLDFLRDPQDLHRFVAVLVALGAAFAIYLLVRWRPPAVISIYAVGLVALAVLSSNTTSVVRFVMGAFPLLIPLASRMSHATFGVVAAASGVLMTLFFFLTGLMFMNP